MLDKLPKIEEWQIKLGIVGVQLVAITILLAYIFSSPIDKAEKKQAKKPEMKHALAFKKASNADLKKTQYHYPGSQTMNIPIDRAMALVLRDAKAGGQASLVPAVGMHDSATRPVGVVAAAADLPPLEMGKWVWNNKGCRACHTLESGAAKLAGPTWAGLYESDRSFQGGGSGKANDAYLIESIKDPRAQIVAGYPPAMPVVKLNKKELAGVIELIKSLKDK